MRKNIANFTLLSWKIYRLFIIEDILTSTMDDDGDDDKNTFNCCR